MNVRLPREVVGIVALLVRSGYEAAIVGGAVRDVFLEKKSSDWDFTTNATPEQIQAVFPESFYENTFGTVGITRAHIWELLQLGDPQSETDFSDELYEVTTYRSGEQYDDHRRPTSLTWGKTLEEDLTRRDFTVNAMAFVLPTETLEAYPHFQDLPAELTVSVRVVDPFHGQTDLRMRMIQAVGDPSQRFEEDALRMLRAVRFAGQLEFRIEPLTLVAIQEKSQLISHVSWERIRDEFLRILVSPHVEDALTLLATTGLLQYILPEILQAKGVEQRGHHVYDVWTHSIKACALCPTNDPIVKLAALLHDIAKPETQAEIAHQPGEFSFYNHEVIGARVARDIARRFRLSNDDVQRIFTLVRWHMFHYQPHMTDAAIRRFIRRQRCA